MLIVMVKRVSKTAQRCGIPANMISAIESRVARIKARVAELTGNMDVPSHSRQH